MDQAADVLGSNRSSLPAAAVDAFAGLLVLSAAADAYSLRRYWSVCLPLPLPALPPAIPQPPSLQPLLRAAACTQAPHGARGDRVRSPMACSDGHGQSPLEADSRDSIAFFKCL